MDKVRLVAVKCFSLLLTGTTLFFSSAKAATPSKCFEIESILVDACGTPEGENEMVRFKIGPTAFNTSDLDITWPNNPYLGISPKTATTTSIVNTLNSTILSCGRLVEPVGGVLPAGKSVLLITSTAVSTSANSFANLTDTLYVIFQMAGNTAGHFVNYSSTPGIRTLIMKRISTGCADSASYDKSLLLNQNLGYGGTSAQNDGGAVEYAWPGYPTPTYVNHGCQAPFIPLTANAGTTAAICPGGIATLTGSISGNNIGVIWRGGLGTFSNSTNVNTTYTAAPSETGSVSVKLGVIGVCHDTVYSTPLVITITNAAAPAVTSPVLYCQGTSSAALTATGSGLLWYTVPSGGTGSASAPTPSTAAAGTTTYYVSQTVNSCHSPRDSIKVTVNSLPNANAGADSSITCGAVSLVLNGSSTSSNVTYSWAGAGIVSGGTTSSPTVNTAGTYTLTVTNLANCTAADQVVITNNSVLPNANAGADSALTCTVPSLILNGSSTTAGAQYSWAGPGSYASNLQTPTITTAGTYTLTVTNPANGCTVTDQVLINDNTTVPTVTAGASGSAVLTCTSTTAVLNGSSTASGAVYSWAGPGGYTSSQQNPSVTTAGTYTLTVTDPGNGCASASSSGQVIITSNTVVPDANAGAASSITCTTQSIVLNGSSAASGAVYSWAGPGSYSSSQQQPIVTAAGTYTLTVTDPANGCTSIPAQVLVSSNNTPPIASAGTDQNIGCGVTSINLDGSGSSSGAGYTYSWTTTGGHIISGGTGVSPNVNQAGSYTLTVTNTGNGCISASTITVTGAPTPIASFTADPLTGIAPVTVNFTNTSQNANTYVWMLGNDGVDTSTDPSHIFSTSGVYNVLLIASENSLCPDTARVSITVLDAFTLIVPNVFTPNGDGTNDQFLVNIKGVTDFECVIFDRWGLKMAELHTLTTGWDGKNLSGKNADSGTYYYTIKATSLDAVEHEKVGFVMLAR